MTAVLVVLHVIISIFLILVVLVQQGKGADIAGAFGGGGSQTAFGARGATTFLHKLTTGAFVAFVAISLLLSILEARPRSSVIKTLPAAANRAPAPVPPGQPAPPAARPAGSAASQAPAAPAPDRPATANPAASATPSKP